LARFGGHLIVSSGSQEGVLDGASVVKDPRHYADLTEPFGDFGPL